MNYTLNIATPIITGSNYFKVRYRTYPGGTFGAYTNYPSNSITLTGLSAGQYEAEIIYNNGEDCPPMLVVFTAQDVPDCWDFSAQILTNGVIYFIRITWLGFTLPICGYRFDWTQGSASGSTTWTGGGGPLDIIVPTNATALLRIYANDCSSIRLCDEFDVEYSGTCTPFLITGTSVQPPDAGSPNYWILTINYNQSTPFTTKASLSAIQTGVKPGFTAATASLTWSPPLSPTTSITIKIYVTPGSFTGSQPTFAGTLTDICGKTHPFTA